MNLTQREKDILSLALSYVAANVDDVNDAFRAYDPEDDEYNEQGLLEVDHERTTSSLDSKEIDRLKMKLTGEAHA